MKISKTYVGERAPLYHHYPRQIRGPQSAYVYVDPEAGTIYADWDGEIGNAMPMDVWHGRRIRWEVNPALTGRAVDRLLHDILPLAERVAAGYEAVWDGNNTVGRLSEDAQEVAEEIARLCEAESNPSDLAQIYRVEDFFEMDDDGITAGSTDQQITARAAEIERETASEGILLDGDVEDYLRDLRDRLAE